MTAKLKPEIKELWTDALLSGDYEQGTKNLNRDGKFCCLGVLCDLAVKSGVNVPVDEQAGGEGIVFYGRHRSTLPIEVDAWATEGMTEESVMTEWQRGALGDTGIIPGTHGTNLADLNDRGKTFEEIAAVIKENF